jgi:hypothetical protein
MTAPTPHSLYGPGGTTSTSVFVEIFSDRDPTPNDTNYQLQQRWFNTVTEAEFMLTSFSTELGTLQANWVEIGGGSDTSGVLSISGIFPDNAGNIDLVGEGSIAVTGAGNTLTTALAGLTNHSVLVGGVSGGITSVPNAAAGDVFISQGGDPKFTAQVNINDTTGAVTVPTGTVTLDSGNLALGTGGVTVGSGNVTLTSGNLSLGTGNINVASGGINFSGGPLLSIYTANTPFTPTISFPGGTVTYTSLGTYKMIGSIVFFICSFQFTAFTAGSGNHVIDLVGLPPSNFPFGGLGMVNAVALTLSPGYTQFQFGIIAGTTNAFLEQDGSGMTAMIIPQSGFASNTQLSLYAWYLT